MKYLVLNGKFLILLTKCSTHLKLALPDTNSFCVPPHLSTHFLFVGTMLLSPSLTFLKFQRVDLISYLSGKGRNAEMKEEQSRNNSAVIKHSPLRNVYYNIFEFFSVGNKVLTQVADAAYQRNDFSRSRTLHLAMHKK